METNSHNLPSKTDATSKEFYYLNIIDHSLINSSSALQNEHISVSSMPSSSTSNNFTQLLQPQSEAHIQNLSSLMFVDPSVLLLQNNESHQNSTTIIPSSNGHIFKQNDIGILFLNKFIIL